MRTLSPLLSPLESPLAKASETLVTASSRARTAPRMSFRFMVSPLEAAMDNRRLQVGHGCAEPVGVVASRNSDAEPTVNKRRRSWRKGPNLVGSAEPGQSSPSGPVRHRASDRGVLAQVPDGPPARPAYPAHHLLTNGAHPAGRHSTRLW